MSALIVPPPASLSSRIHEPFSLRIPTSAATIDGFREWFASPAFPDDIRASYFRDELYIEPRWHEMDSLRIPTSAATIDGFREWFASPAFPDDIRASFLGDEILIEQRMEDFITHNQIKAIVSAILMIMVKERRLGRFSSDGMMLNHKKAGVSTIPDAIFASYAGIESGRVRLTTIGRGEILVEWQGSPDWVLEVVSRNSEKKDYHDLLEDYYRAGIAEYWLIDARGDTIVFRIHRAGANGYEIVPEQDGWVTSSTFGRRFRLTRELDQANMWLYDLQIG